jgi:hypothetical protein
MIQFLQIKYPAICIFRTDCQSYSAFKVNNDTLSCSSSSSGSGSFFKRQFAIDSAQYLTDEFFFVQTANRAC